MPRAGIRTLGLAGILTLAFGALGTLAQTPPPPMPGPIGAADDATNAGHRRSNARACPRSLRAAD